MLEKHTVLFYTGGLYIDRIIINLIIGTDKIGQQKNKLALACDKIVEDICIFLLITENVTSGQT